MTVHHIPFRKTGYFSNLICDYLDENDDLKEFYDQFPSIEGFKKQIEIKHGFSGDKRSNLVNALNVQYDALKISRQTRENINAFNSENTFSITTGHQLNIFTGPLYFLYKIVSTIQMTKRLKEEFPQNHFVPVYWMATEDHDFEEINFFNFKESKLSWNIESKGAVGRLRTKEFESLAAKFGELLGNSTNAGFLKNLFENAYLKHENLTQATRYLVNELFGAYGLVILDGDDKLLKGQFTEVMTKEVLDNTAISRVASTSDALAKEYHVQVNPRPINLFYLKEGLRERILFENETFQINNTELRFTKSEIIDEIQNFPERFSPNVIVRPLYQEFILPNLAYIGGGGELAYWFQLKKYFQEVEIPFPIVLLRNSAVFVSSKQLLKLNKLNISINEMFLKQPVLIDKKVKEVSEVDIDFSVQRKHLMDQFQGLKELAKRTDRSFMGAVLAQEKKQLNGLNNLEKRLLKAQKRKLVDEVQRITKLQNELFPKNSLEERTRNFSELYLELGEELIPTIFNSLDPLKHQFTIIEY